MNLEDKKDFSIQLVTTPPIPPVLILYAKVDEDAAKEIAKKEVGVLTLIATDTAVMTDAIKDSNLILVGNWKDNVYTHDLLIEYLSYTAGRISQKGCEALEQNKYWMEGAERPNDTWLNFIFGCTNEDTYALALSYPHYPEVDESEPKGVITEFTAPAEAEVGEQINVHLSWKNIGKEGNIWMSLFTVGGIVLISDTGERVMGTTTEEVLQTDESRSTVWSFKMPDRDVTIEAKVGH